MTTLQSPMCESNYSKPLPGPGEYWIHEDPEKTESAKEKFGDDPFHKIIVKYYPRTPRNYHVLNDGVLAMFQIVTNTNDSLSDCNDWFIPHPAVYHYRNWAYKMGISSIDIVYVLLLLARAQDVYKKRENTHFIFRYYHIVAATYISQSILYDQPLNKHAWHDCLAAWMIKDDRYPAPVDHLYGKEESFERVLKHVFDLFELVEYSIYYTENEFNDYSNFMNYNSLVDKLK